MLVFNIAFKNTTTVLFSFFFSWLKKEKGMDAKVHGPVYTRVDTPSEGLSFTLGLTPGYHGSKAHKESFTI